jgi:hypothetical protein
MVVEARNLCRRFIGDGRVIEGKRAGEVSIAGNTVRRRTVPKTGTHNNENSECFHEHRRSGYAGRLEPAELLQQRPDPERDTDKRNKGATQDLPIAFKSAEPNALKACGRVDA